MMKKMVTGFADRNLKALPGGEAVSFVIGDKAYIGTGYDGEDRLQDFWEYDPTQNFWQQKAQFPGVGRNSAVGFSVGTNGYITTGYDGINDLKDCWQYNSLTNAWEQKADFAGSARYDAVACGIGDKGYVSTGFDGNYLKDTWAYDTGSDTWTQKISMGGNKRSAAVCYVNADKMYICLGNNNGVTTNDLWMYDPSDEAWSEKRKIASISDEDYDDDYTDIVRYNAVAFVLGGKAYISTGTSGSLVNKTWEYNIATDLWQRKTPFEGNVRTGAVAFTIASRGYIATGTSSGSYFDDILEFKPDETYEDND
jgi:N-acetylneuraminic acid mutarotase